MCFRRNVCFLAIIFFWPHAHAGTMRRVPQMYKTIQAAIDAARVGDTVLVDHGVYYENIHINKNIVLASRFIVDGNRSHVDQTIIDGSRPADKLKASVVLVQGRTDTTCVLVGFTLRGGTGTSVVFPKRTPGPNRIGGGGILILNAGARIAHNIVTANVLSGRFTNKPCFAAGVASVDTTDGEIPPPFLIVEHNIITGNNCSGEYGEVAGVKIAQPALVQHNVITANHLLTQNRARGGGLTTVVRAFEIIIDGNYISHNTGGIGAGMRIFSDYIRQGRTIVSNNIISENEAAEVGGGVHIAEVAVAVLIHNTIVNNVARAGGGGVNFMETSDLSLINNIVWNNVPDQLSSRQLPQSSHNLIEGGYPGITNSPASPLFLPHDTLYRLSPESPAVGTGAGEFLLTTDYDGNARSLPVGSSPDLGAVESPWSENDLSASLKSEWKDLADAVLKLNVCFRQLGAPTMDPGNLYALRGGRVAATITVNDKPPLSYRDSTPELSFVLPPGKNFLELEVDARGRDTTRGLICSFRLEGLDWENHVLYKGLKSLRKAYPDLRPGPYTLVFFPLDDIDYSDRANNLYVHILVLPYWYQRWWAYALYGLGVIVLVAGMFQVRINRLRLEDQVKMKGLEAQKLVEVDRLKSRFFANLSHEFRTPLSLILGPVDQLETSETQSDRKRQLGMVKRSAERLLRMVNLLLQFARIESGTLKLRVSLQPIPQLLRRIVSSFSTAAVKKGIALQADIEPEFFEGYLDTEKVEHVLENLLSNALKYTPSEGRVEMRARRLGTELLLEVSDTGPGIPPEHLAHVFERFYRVDSSHQHEGTGIGLSLSKELVEMHHGSIEIKSNVGTGTTATVRIPLSGYSEQEIARQTPPAVEGKAGVSEEVHASQEIPSVDYGDKTVVLVVEDNDDAREYIRSRLTPEFEIVATANGIQAWEKSIQHIPDIVVSDVMMPEMSGYELCAKLKQDERTSHIPVILLTALADRTDKIEGLQTGADDYLVKPFDARELLVRVRNLIANRKRIQERFKTTVQLRPGEVKVESLDDKF
ncbi:MAG: ATP-binding protein, partial [Bacteroidota bacterium]